ncbi:hypothetical protein SCUCBS95973_008772 [Sporothrix curviconia]|uniref:Peptidase C45 hydrolase domain-containing protein n=1 Tax=Sporothrix curviconia TaxID=1260050 RepID=A0ABP0CQ60_9PEZI
MVFKVRCSGSPYEIGQDHGRQARAQIHGCIAFYTGMFQKTASLGWDAVQATALEFVPTIQTKWPALLEEMQGIADAAGLLLADIVALNVRTEIAFGLFSDGCTALAWQTPDTVFLAQNWDWMEEQKENLVLVHITQPGLPSVKYLAEAGLVGKIGLNSNGVGVLLNAIRAQGVDRTRLPVHLALRVLLNAESMAAARAAVEKDGIAASCHILLGDRTGAVGLECSHLGIQALAFSDKKRIHHTNHFLLDHPSVQDTRWIPDSTFRQRRIEALADGVQGNNVNVPRLQELFKDTVNVPGAICRSATKDNTVATLFNIVMDLGKATAEVLMGRPNAPDEKITLAFAGEA